MAVKNNGGQNRTSGGVVPARVTPEGGRGTSSAPSRLATVISKNSGRLAGFKNFFEKFRNWRRGFGAETNYMLFKRRTRDITCLVREEQGRIDEVLLGAKMKKETEVIKSRDLETHELTEETNRVFRIELKRDFEKVAHAVDSIRRRVFGRATSDSEPGVPKDEGQWKQVLKGKNPDEQSEEINAHVESGLSQLSELEEAQDDQKGSLLVGIVPQYYKPEDLKIRPRAIADKITEKARRRKVSFTKEEFDSLKFEFGIAREPGDPSGNQGLRLYVKDETGSQTHVRLDILHGRFSSDNASASKKTFANLADKLNKGTALIGELKEEVKNVLTEGENFVSEENQETQKTAKKESDKKWAAEREAQRAEEQAKRRNNPPEKKCKWEMTAVQYNY